MVQKEIEIGGRTVVWRLERKEVKNLNLRIRRDGTVSVSANCFVSEEYIEKFIRAKASFILNALDHYADIERQKPARRLFADGEIFRVLGHELELKVLRGVKNSVTSDGRSIFLRVTEPFDADLKKKVLGGWLCALCRETVTAVCREIYPKFSGIKFPEIRFRNMRTRWGSCMTQRSVLTFSYALAAVPRSCIEYVVMHEFTHFLHADHSARFYAQLSALMPDWRERKALLAQNSSFFADFMEK